MRAVANALTQEEKKIDEIEAFCLHLGEILRAIKNPVRSLKLRMNLTSEAMMARLEDEQETLDRS